MPSFLHQVLRANRLTLPVREFVRADHRVQLITTGIWTLGDVTRVRVLFLFFVVNGYRIYHRACASSLRGSCWNDGLKSILPRAATSRLSWWSPEDVRQIRSL